MAKKKIWLNRYIDKLSIKGLWHAVCQVCIFQSAELNFSDANIEAEKHCKLHFHLVDIR